jgi:hypothetical protein
MNHASGFVGGGFPGALFPSPGVLGSISTLQRAYILQILG